jgi:hypothetical protein
MLKLYRHDQICLRTQNKQRYIETQIFKTADIKIVYWGIKFILRVERIFLLEIMYLSSSPSSEDTNQTLALASFNFITASFS